MKSVKLKENRTNFSKLSRRTSKATVEAGLGKYLVCSLFSPMYESSVQRMAVVTANSVLKELMQVDNQDTVSTHEKTIEKIWCGEQAVQREPGEAMSRRVFLRVGRWPRGEQQYGD